MSERNPVVEFRREAIAVSKKLHSIMARVEFVDGSMVGTLAGILLYAISVHRTLGLPHSALHTLIDALDYDFVVGEEQPTTTAKRRDVELSAAVRAADEEADRIIAAAQAAADKEEGL